MEVEVEGDAPHHDQPEGQLHDLRQGANVINTKYYSLFLQNFHKCELLYEFFFSTEKVLVVFITASELRTT